MDRPLILDFAQNRTKEISPPFRYDYLKNLNVIKSQNKEVPFIAMSECNKGSNFIFTELETKTFSEREEDDDDPDYLELLTKTKQHREGDDDNFMELVTKTDANREGDDDNDFIYY